MKRLRIGKDFGLSWKIKAKNAGENAPYTPSSDSLLLLVTPYNKVKAEGATFDGDTVRWIFRGKDQKHIGVYGLELVENQGKNGMITIDTCEAFELVEHTCEETGHDGESLIFDTLEFITDVELNALRGPEGPQGPQGPVGPQGPAGSGSAITPDWNASEGAKGYIKNRTHYFNPTATVSASAWTFDNQGEPKKATAALNADWLYRFELSGNTYYIKTDSREDMNKQILSNGQWYVYHKCVGGQHSLEFSRYGTEITDIPAEIQGAPIGAATTMGFLKPLNEMFIPDTIARKSELTKLSAEKEDKANKTTTLSSASTDTQYPSAKAVYEAIQQSGGGGASSDKQGVVSQTLNYNTADNTYSVSNVVRGSIPSFFIDLVTEAGASFNAESGYFSLNGIDNIAYDEMRKIYDCRTGYCTNSLLAAYGRTYTARTNFTAFRGYGASYVNHEPTTIYTKYLCGQNASITKFALCDEVALYVRAGSGNNFESFGSGAEVLRRSRLEEIIGVLDVTNLTGSNNFFYNGAWQPWLTSFQLKSLKASIDLSGMPRLSEATILYMINNEKAASAITIKLHADAKAMADASEAIQSALANHANITLGV